MPARVMAAMAIRAGEAGSSRRNTAWRSSTLPAWAWNVRRAWPPRIRPQNADSRLNTSDTAAQAATALGRSFTKRNPTNAASVGEKLGINESPVGARTDILDVWPAGRNVKMAHDSNLPRRVKFSRLW